MPLTDEQRATLQLISRSPDRGDGWRTCAPMLFEKLIKPMPDELVEKDSDQLLVRLTPQSITILDWM